MPKFTKAIVRTPSPSMVDGISSADLGVPNYEKALLQHEDYIKALKSCGLEVIVLEATDKFPDSTFVEDVALCTPLNAIITNPGAQTRKDEIHNIIPTIQQHFEIVNTITAPGTVEAGDIMMVGNYYYIGLSERTNLNGAHQVLDILKEHGMNGTTVEMKDFLHLKTGLSYLENKNLLVIGEFIEHSLFQQFNKVIVDQDEAYAANSVWINDKVLVPFGFPKTQAKIEKMGYETIGVNVSEFEKLDGGLSCLSLRF